MSSSQRQLFNNFLKSCREDLPKERSHDPVFDKIQQSEVSKFREAEALHSGALLEAMVEQGKGTSSPVEGDLVYIHFSIHADGDEEDTVYSTRPENGSTDGTPLAVVLEKSPRLPRAWEIALREMKMGERRVLKVRPEFGFRHKECEYHLPDQFQEKEQLLLHIDLQLLNWYEAKNVIAAFGATDDRILKLVLREGEGYENPRAPYLVKAYVTLRKLAVDGVQLKGEMIFSSETPIEVELGNDSVPAAIQSCLCSMIKNEKAVCIFRARNLSDQIMAPGLFPPLPQNVEQLEAEIEIVHIMQVRDIHGDGKIVKYRTVDGRGTFPSDCPLQDCNVKIHYKARSHIEAGGNSTTDTSTWSFDSRLQDAGNSLSIDLGCGDLPWGLEASIRLMLPGEISRVECSADSAYKNANTRCRIPEGIEIDDNVEFEVELLGFDKGMQWIGISTQEALVEGQKMKEIANNLYNLGATKLAANKYKSIAQHLSQLRDFDLEEHVQESDKLTINCYGNLASCAIQDEEYTTAIDWCTKALKMDEENAKILLRRARAHSLRCDFDDAEIDLREVERLDPALKADVDTVLLKNRQRRKAAAQKQRDQFKNFFDRS